MQSMDEWIRQRAKEMRREPVLVAVDRYGAKPELRGGTKTSDRDLGTVRDEQLLHADLKMITGRVNRRSD